MPEFTKVWAMVVPEPSTAPVKVGALLRWVQAKVVPATVEAKAIEIRLPVQMVVVAGVAVATGVGLTVTVTLALLGLTHPKAIAST